METEVKELLEQTGVPSTKVAALEVAEVVKCIDSHLSEVTNKVLWLMGAILGLDNESLDKLEEQLTNEWDDTPIFEHVRGHIMAVIDSYHQDRVLKQLDEKFKQLKNLESDYTVLRNGCLELLGRLNNESLRTISNERYHSVFVNNILDEYFEGRAIK
jgi:hypothetical protein